MDARINVVLGRRGGSMGKVREISNGFRALESWKKFLTQDCHGHSKFKAGH